MEPGILIVGAGQAGVQAALSLRDGNYQGPITLVGNEPFAPYQRPPLSKTFLDEDCAPASLFLKSPEALTNRGIRWISSTLAKAIERDKHQLVLADDTFIPYDRLVLATGTRSRPLTVPGASADGVYMLRGIEDAQILRRALKETTNAVIIGGGFIGLEVAASLRKQEIDVLLLEAGPRVCERACLPETSIALLRNLREIGVDARTDAQVSAISSRNGKAYGVELSDGQRIRADLVLVCIGVVPNTELADAAGLTCDNGVCVDETLRTEDPNIFAIGDCARFPFSDQNDMIRFESVPNATAQGRHVASIILGSTAPFRAMPWFWSDQGALKLQMVGVTAQIGPERSVHVAPRENGQVAFCLAEEKLCGIECINAPLDFVTARKLLNGSKVVSRADLIAADWNLQSISKMRAA